MVGLCFIQIYEIKFCQFTFLINIKMMGKIKMNCLMWIMILRSLTKYLKKQRTVSHADNGGDGGVSNKTSPCWSQFVKYKGEDKLRTRCKWCGATCASHS